MKKFIYKSALFCFIFISIYAIVEITSAMYISAHADFGLKLNPKYLVLGHSHSECAFNDSLITNLVNLSASGEPYFYSFQKLKKILESNKSITTVFIEYTNNQIAENMNDWTWGNYFMSHWYPRYSSFMNIEDHALLMRKNFKDALHVFQVSSKIRITRILDRDFDYLPEMGGYLFLVRDKTDSLVKAADTQNLASVPPDNYAISDYNILYLAKMVQFCKANNKRVILMRSPMHVKYGGFGNESRYKEILAKQFKDTEYLDLSKFPLPDNEFGDLEHLNYRGARKFSLWFNELIHSGLMEKPLDQGEIESRMRAIRKPNDSEGGGR